MQLTKRVAVYVPSTVNVACPAPTRLIDEWVRKTKLFLAQQVGGYTVHPATGGWLNGDNLVEETVTVVYGYTNDTTGLLPLLEEFALELGRAMGQACVAVENGNGLRIIDTPALAKAA